MLYGPSSLYFGRGSTGGVINQVSKQPNLKPRADVSLQAGTHDRYRSTIDINQPLTDTAAFRVNAFAQLFGSNRDEMRSKDAGIAPEVKFGIGTPTQVTLSALIQHNRDQVDYGIPPVNGHLAPVDTKTFYGFTDDRLVQRADAQRACRASFQRHVHAAQPDAVQLLQHRVARDQCGGRADRPTRLLARARERQLHDATAVVAIRAPARQGPQHQRSLGLQHDRFSGEVRDRLPQARHARGRRPEPRDVQHQSFTATTPGLPSNTLAIVPLVNPAYVPRPANVNEVATNLAESSANGIGLYLNDTISIGEHWK